MSQSFITADRIRSYNTSKITIIQIRLVVKDGQPEYVNINSATQTPYSEFFKSAKIATLTDGRSDVLSNGDLFVEETKFGRILRGNQNNTIWQYSQRIDSKSVAALFWSRFVTSDEFKQLTFLNNKN